MPLARITRVTRSSSPTVANPEIRILDREAIPRGQRGAGRVPRGHRGKDRKFPVETTFDLRRNIPVSFGVSTLAERVPMHEGAPVPTYQYACKECGHSFEAVQSFSDASLTECPECTGPLRKLYGAVGVIFKGSGFYRNDSRSESSSKSSSGSGKSSAGSSSTSESKSTSSDSNSSSSSTGTTKTAAAAS